MLTLLLNSVVTDISYRLCAPVSGINEGANLSGVLTSSRNASTPVIPAPPITFMGSASCFAVSGGWIFIAIVVAITGL